MKLISWNVNGLRACLNKGFAGFFSQLDADIFSIQETKMQPGQAVVELPGYLQYWNSAERKGYSGTAVFTRREPLSVTYGLGIEEHDHEGRVITLEYPEFYLVNCYTPNSKQQLERLDYRMVWEDAMRDYLCGLDAKKPVVYCGDLNVAHQPIDLKNPKPNEGNAGYTAEERQKLTELLESGFLDSFRTLYPDKTGAYSWWSYRFNARANNAGWRIDYFIISRRLREHLVDSTIWPEVTGSDHCPVGLELSFA
ncbi:MAG TPA: exodeoxyribonuclease III [Candidatus Pygmaiobacter gallistercoris]|nr:exodeoxyribonuclease III [Candidatus Pygmaiobacter gallistercoris]